MRGMNVESTSSGQIRNDRTKNVNGSLDKRKACVFLVLVAIGVLCVCAILYALFYAGPSRSAIPTTGHSLMRQIAPPVRRPPVVHS